MLYVYLLRHGETTYNADGNRYCGRTDAALTPNGLSQAERVAASLKAVRLDAVYASPLQRAFRTAGIASGGSVPVITDDRLIEADFGTWEGKTREEFVTENPPLWETWENGPDHVKAGGTGETGLEIVTRVDDFFREMYRRHKGGTILVTAHNGVNRLYLAYKLGMPLKNYRRLVQENSAVTLFELNEGSLSLLKLNA